jgi:hypothetical protein
LWRALGAPGSLLLQVEAGCCNSAATSPRSRRKSLLIGFAVFAVLRDQVPVPVQGFRGSSQLLRRAERVGFEPTRRFDPPTRFPVAHLKPLGHLSEPP